MRSTLHDHWLTILNNFRSLSYRDCDPEPSVFTMLNGRPLTAHLLMRRIPMETVPDDPEEAAMWLHRLYQHKVDYYITAFSLRCECEKCVKPICFTDLGQVLG
jgi:hypothetical protein